ncbi:MAG: DDE-type integrase/transposase/recombinase [Alphaproteobacteria bacterium]
MISVGEIWLTATQLADMELPNLATRKRNINARAIRENWPYRDRKGRGGGREYPLSALPASAQTAYIEREKVKQKGQSAALNRSLLTKTLDEVAASIGREKGLAKYAHMQGKPKERADARMDAVIAFERFYKERGLSQRQARPLFISAWNTGAIAEDACKVLPNITARSLQNWQFIQHQGGTAALAGFYGNRKHDGKINRDQDVQDLILAAIHDHPTISTKLVMRVLRERLPAERVPSYRTTQRFIQSWKTENKQLHTAMVNPDAWRSGYRASGGDADAGVIRVNQRWEIDSTPGDVLLSDGRRHAVIGVIDVYTRRLKLHVARTSSSHGIMALLRRAIKEWGVPEVLYTDNGQDYVSKQVTRVLHDLAIEHHLSKPFSPEEKPFIERSFRTFSHDLLELTSGFIGHSVAERKGIEARQSFASRLMKGGETVSLERLSPDEFQAFCDRWCDDIYAHTGHSSLNSQTPFAVSAAYPGKIKRVENERSLDILLAPTVDGDGFRYVTKKGLRIEGASFQAPELGGLEGQRVRILVDESDIGSVYVFSEEEKFICKAICPERTGIDLATVVAARKEHQRKVLAEAKKEIRAKSRKAKLSTIVTEILDTARVEAARIVAFPRGGEAHSTPAIEAAGEAARVNTGELPKLKPLTPEQEAFRSTGTLLPMRIKEKDPLVEADERYERALQIADMGIAACEDDRRWLDHYKETSEFRTIKRHREDTDAFLAANTA